MHELNVNDYQYQIIIDHVDSHILHCIAFAFCKQGIENEMMAYHAF